MATSITQIVKNRSKAEMAQLKSSFFAMSMRDAAQHPELYIEGDQIENCLDVLYILDHLHEIM